MSFLENDFFLLAVTFGIFFFAKLLQKKTGLVLLNAILLTIAVLIIFLKMTHISYETYNKGGHLIEFWLRPAVVALGVPLYLQLEMIKKKLQIKLKYSQKLQMVYNIRLQYWYLQIK